ncbi:putative estradiol 17 beta-dehydrogenase [Apodospora peruviana]|uniref:Estradiol 17 beta-dehydrogenase n=1 Tax=Apodospora peruviana TaxID=516989 RepID=A0AAE0I1U4_9PEZI|nr:putative estradiol 17 beta-dehydrogenase [Apodospora peruviana]
MPSFSTFLTHFFPPKSKFTDRDVPDLQGNVYIVTGANTGIGKEVARVLYAKNAKVYVAARPEEKAQNAISEIQNTVTASTGSLIFLHLKLSDLTKVKATVGTFLAQEQKLHVLFNNAGVMVSTVDPPLKSAQGHGLGLGVNCVGTFLFIQLLTPTFVATARSEPPNTVRVVWVSSFGLELFAQSDVGLSTKNLDYHIPKDATERYGQSKIGAWALGVEYAKRYKGNGIVSVPINPGNLQTELARDQKAMVKLIAKLLCYPAINGAYTELHAACSDDVTVEKADWGTEYPRLTKLLLAPWGRIYPLRPDLTKATMTEAEGGTGRTSKFWDWTEQQQVEAYL